MATGGGEETGLAGCRYFINFDLFLFGNRADIDDIKGQNGVSECTTLN